MGGQKSTTKQQQNTNQTVQLPAWMSQGGEQNFNNAQAWSQANPVTAYTGARTAGMSGNQTQASQTAASTVGQGQADLNAGRALTFAGATGPALWTSTSPQAVTTGQAYLQGGAPTVGAETQDSRGYTGGTAAWNGMAPAPQIASGTANAYNTNAAYGTAANGNAVHGAATLADAAHGTATTGDAIHGTATLGNAVHGQATDGVATLGTASHGAATHGDATLGTAYGANAVDAQAALMQAAQRTGYQGYNAALLDPSLAPQVHGQNVTTDKFNSAAAKEYMNPYLDNVQNVVMDRMKREQAESRASLNDSLMVGSKAFGGSGQALLNSQLMGAQDRDLQEYMATSQADAYDKAGSMFTSDQGRKLSADQGNQSTDLQAQIASGTFLDNLLGRNQGAANDASKFNADAFNTFDNDNAGYTQDANRTNANNLTSTANSNADRWTTTNNANADRATNMSNWNAGRLTDMSNQNAQRDTDTSNSNARMDSDMSNNNSQRLTDMSDRNAQRTTDMSDANAARDTSMNNSNADRLSNMSDANAGRDTNMVNWNADRLTSMSDSNATRDSNMYDSNANRLSQMSDANAGRDTSMNNSNADRLTTTSNQNAQRDTDAWLQNARLNTDVSQGNADRTLRADQSNQSTAADYARQDSQTRNAANIRDADAADTANRVGAEAWNTAQGANADRRQQASTSNATFLDTMLGRNQDATNSMTTENMRARNSAADADANRSLDSGKTNAQIQQSMLDRLLSAGGQFGNFGVDSSNLNTSDITNLLRTGQVEQDTAQGGMDRDYEEFMRMQNAGLDRYSTLAGILSGTPRDVTTNGSMTGKSTTKTSPGLMNELMAAGQLAAAFASDRRLKRDVEKLGTLDDGLGVYRYRYHWSDRPQVGVMAQEVAKLRPEALGPPIGPYMSVDYSKLREFA